MKILNLTTALQANWAILLAHMEGYAGRKEIARECGINFSKLDSFLFGKGKLLNTEKRALEEYLTLKIQQRVRKKGW